MSETPPQPAETPVRESGRIARAVGVLSSATALSRILGLVRDVVTAAYFGAGGAMDAFFVAFRLPNTLRRLFAEGSLTVAFVPVFVHALEEEGTERAHTLGRRALTLLGAVLAVVSVVGVLGAPWLVRVTAWGFTQDPEKFDLTVRLTRIVFPFIALVGLTALAGGMLNAWGVFSYPALAPVVLNACMIAAVVAFAPAADPPILALAWGVLVGGILQLALQGVPLRQWGFRFRIDVRWKDPAIGRILRLMGPTVFGVAVYQVNILISTFLASWLPDGSVSYLYYAERLFQLPLGVFAVSFGTASLPSLSRLAVAGRNEEFVGTVAEALRMTAFVVLPASVGLCLLARPILTVLLQRGAFDAAMVDATARALFYYSLALLPVAWVRVLAPAFYALQDTQTPVKAAFWSLWVNVVASLVLMGPMAHAGLALATSVSSAFNLAYLWAHLHRRVGELPLDALRAALLRTLGASAAMGAAVWGVSVGVSWEPGLLTGGILGAVVVGGVALYIAVGRVVGLRDATLVTRLLARKLGMG